MGRRCTGCPTLPASRSRPMACSCSREGIHDCASDRDRLGAGMRRSPSFFRPEVGRKHQQTLVPTFPGLILMTAQAETHLTSSLVTMSAILDIMSGIADIGYWAEVTRGIASTGEPIEGRTG